MRGRGARKLPAAAVIFALAGCGASTVPHQPQGSKAQRQAEQALRLWGRFTTTATPRPIVLLEGPVLDPDVAALSRYVPRLRRVLHPERIIAFDASQFVLLTKLPDAPRQFRGWQVVTAVKAFSLLLRSPAKRFPNLPRMRLPITAARLTVGSFSTDRGLQTLPVWAFTVQGLKQPVRVLAVPGSRVFNPPMPWGGENATVSDDGSQLRLSFVGGAAGDKPCDDSYTAETVTDGHAVAVWLIDHPVKGAAICSTVGYPRTVAVHLARPLGPRVLVEAYGAPIPVCRTRARPPFGAVETCRPAPK
jgi:hypothetical protein